MYGLFKNDAYQNNSLRQVFLSEEYSVPIINLNTIFHTHPRYDKDFAFVVSFKSPKPNCTRQCFNGACRILPYSSKMECQCREGFNGDRCQFSDNDIKHQLAMFAVLKSPIKLPSIASIQNTMDNTELFVEIAMGNIENALLTMETNVMDRIKELDQGITRKLEWMMMVDKYSDSIENLIYFGKLSNLTYIREHELTSKCQPEQFEVNHEKEGIAQYLLNPFGIQKWLDDLNFLIMGRNEISIDSHKPVVYIVMDKLTDRVCFADYIAAIDRTFVQLTLLQQQGYVMWIHAYSLLKRNSYHLVERLINVLSKQNNFRKTGYCSINMPNSNLVNCSGYIHQFQDVSLMCDENYYLTGNILPYIHLYYTDHG